MSVVTATSNVIRSCWATGLWWILNKGTDEKDESSSRDALSHTHTSTYMYGGGPNTEVREREQGLIPAAGTCACVCVSKHLGRRRLPLHRPTGTSGSDSNNGSNAGGGGMVGGGGQSGMRGWYLRLCPRHPQPPPPPQTGSQYRTLPSPHIVVYSSSILLCRTEIIEGRHFGTHFFSCDCISTHKIYECLFLYVLYNIVNIILLNTIILMCTNNNNLYTCLFLQSSHLPTD